MIAHGVVKLSVSTANQNTIKIAQEKTNKNGLLYAIRTRRINNDG